MSLLDITDSVVTTWINLNIKVKDQSTCKLLIYRKNKFIVGPLYD